MHEHGEPTLPINVNEEFLYEAIQEQFPGGQFINLARNENPLGASPAANELLREATFSLNRYPSVVTPFKRDLATQLGNGLTPDYIMVTNGASEVLHQVTRTFLNPGDEIIFCEPTFNFFRFVASARNAQVISVPLQDHRYDLQGIVNMVGPRTKLVIVCNPNSPTGTYVSAQEVDAFIEAVPENVMILFDEAYYDFVTAPDYPRNMSGWIKKRNVLLARTFSKGYGLAGMRVGYCVACPEIIHTLHKMKLPYTVSSVSILAAQAAFHDQAFIAQSRDFVQRERERLTNELRQHGLTVPDSQTNFLFVETESDSYRVADGLLKKGIWVRNATESALRVSIGTHIENDNFLQALFAVLEDTPAAQPKTA